MNRVDLKVVLLGSEYVGKSSMLERFVHDRFSENSYQNTIGAAFAAKQMESNSKKIMIGVWDTAGSERYEAMSRMYYRGAKAAIICYDICTPYSWDRAKFWINELRRQEENCLIYLCGTKIDIASKRLVPNSTAVQYADSIQVFYMETSSKTGENVGGVMDLPHLCQRFNEVTLVIVSGHAYSASRHSCQTGCCSSALCPSLKACARISLVLFWKLLVPCLGLNLQFG